MPDKSANNNGYILMEALVAITIITVGLMGIFALLSRSLSLNRVVADRYVASYLAAEGIEIVKNLIDNNLVGHRPWNSGFSGGEFSLDYNDVVLGTKETRPLNFDEDSGRYSYDEGRPSRFYRTIKIQLLGGGEEIKVNSIVNWTGRGGADFTVELEDRFFNWR